ncbi:MAG: c-type cytochrome [Bacteroidia bacterium]|nr:c-type cytochrome [Bacteroidia bacterium]
MKKILVLLGASLALVACKEQEETIRSAGPQLPSKLYSYVWNRSQPTFTGNSWLRNVRITDEKATLGRVLFYDKALSVNNVTSCGSCHMQSKGFGDGKALSEGFLFNETPRHSMHIVNTGANSRFFWDGRSVILKDQVLLPISNHIEMGLEDENLLIAKVDAIDYYDDLFEEAYGNGLVTKERIAEALASFVGSIVSYNTKFDQVERGVDRFTALEEKGKDLFNNKYNCASCHGGKNFNAEWGETAFSNIGLDAEDTDEGLNGRFKVPNLRNVMVSAPYMHDGRFSTIEEVLNHYSSGLKQNANLDWRLRQFDPTGMNISPDEKEALIAFLHTLTDYDLLSDPKYSDPF